MFVVLQALLRSEQESTDQVDSGGQGTACCRQGPAKAATPTSETTTSKRLRLCQKESSGEFEVPGSLPGVGASLNGVQNS